MTQIIAKSIKTETYPGLEINTTTDRDVLARACGFMPHHPVNKSTIIINHEGKEYHMIITHYATGEQSFCDADDEDIQELLDKANNNEINQEEDIKRLAELIDNQEVEFRENCWYEADITITKDKDTIMSDYESNIGLEGVKGSISEILNEYKDDENLISTFQWLMEEYS